MIAVTRFDRPAFDNIHRHFAPIYWRTGRPPLLSKMSALMLVLTYLSSTVNINSLVRLHGLCSSTTYEAVNKSMRAGVTALQQMTESCVQWPSVNEMGYLAGLVNAKYPAVNGCFFFVDGCRLCVHQNRLVVSHF